MIGFWTIIGIAVVCGLVLTCLVWVTEFMQDRRDR